MALVEAWSMPTNYSALSNVVKVVGFVFCIALMIFSPRVVSRVIAEADGEVVEGEPVAA
jgi:hypothetical protein